MSPIEENVQAARDRYLAENSFSLSGYTSPTFRIVLGGILPILLPNPGLLHLHDLHHVATGYGTGVIGEAEISVFELRGGCRTFLIHFLCVSSIFLAMFLSPRRVLRAWRKTVGSRTLYFSDIPYERLLEMNVGELRKSMGIPEDGFAEHGLEK